MRLLELFCGTKSVGKIFEEAGYEVVSLDYNPSFDATHTCDILTWNYTTYAPDYFDVIWASPDCTTWSLATGGKYRLKSSIYGLNNERQDKATIGNNMVLKVLEILKYFQPNSWFIENPRGLMQYFPPLQEFIDEYGGNMNLVYYANYNNWGFPKPTHIWSNLTLWDNETIPTMSPDSYIINYRKYDGIVRRLYKEYYYCKERSKTRSKIPPDLIKRLMQLI